MAATQFECGSKLYIFSKKKLPGGACIIDSHGARPPTATSFKVPAGVTVHFYVHRHAFLCVDQNKSYKRDNTLYYSVSSVAEISAGFVRPVESYGPGTQCPNYLLSKQVKGHKDIFHHRAANRYDKISYDDLMAFADSASDKFDIVSVRDRFGKLVFLDDVVTNTFPKYGANYTDIHCSFCRGGFMDMVKDMRGNGLNEVAGGRRV